MTKSAKIFFVSLATLAALAALYAGATAAYMYYYEADVVYEITEDGEWIEVYRTIFENKAEEKIAELQELNPDTRYIVFNEDFYTSGIE